MVDTRRAAKAFEDFTGHKATRVKRSRLDDRDVIGWRMGPMIGVAYEAKRDGETKPYFHEFSKSARPDLVARDDGRKLYIDGGRYKVTDRGIEDMPFLATVNPSARKGRTRRKAPMARRRTARRPRRATRQVAIFRTNPRRRRRTTRGRRRSFARNPTVIARRNPRRRRRSVARRSYRRNPSVRGIGGGLMKLIVPAAGIGAGAVGSEIIMGYLPIPAAWKTGVMRHITKGAVGITAGMLIGKVLRQKQLGKYIALGAVVIATHDALKEFIAARMPGVPMGMYMPRGTFAGMGYSSPAMLGEYVGSPSFAGAATLRGTGGEMNDFAV